MDSNMEKEDKLMVKYKEKESGKTTKELDG